MQLQRPAVMTEVRIVREPMRQAHIIADSPECREHWEASLTGKIRTLRVDKGFGFIKDDSGKEFFFHQSAIYGEGIDNLREGDSVEFDVGEGPKGPRAENVRRTST
jgi:CspA family cold shock protein